MYMILEALYYSCCFGWKKKEEQRILRRIKDDIEVLTEEELDHLKNFILKPLKRNLSCC